MYSSFYKEPLATIRKMVRYLAASIPFLYSKPEPVLCDILFIGGLPVHLLSGLLKKRGFRVCQEVLGAGRILFNRMLSEPDRTLPPTFRFYSAVLNFLLNKYHPKVVCGFLDRSPLASLLKHACRERGIKSINIAHGITDPRPFFDSMFDFDYYFLFGQSSLKHIAANPVRIGNTKAVLAGSPFITPDYKLPPNREKKNVLFFSQIKHVVSHALLYAPTHMEQLIENTRLVVDWAKAHPDFRLFMKVHPAGDAKFTHKLCKGIRNIAVLEKSISMIDALKDVSLVINTVSNASLEAAVLNRPTVGINTRSLWKSYLSLEDFFLPAATNVEELHQNIVQTFEQYEEFLQKTQEFAGFHLEHTIDSVEFIADCIESIYYGEENFSCIPIKEDLSGLVSNQE